MNNKLILNTTLIGLVLIGCKKENLPEITSRVEAVTSGSSKPKEPSSKGNFKKTTSTSSKTTGTKAGSVSKPTKPVKTERGKTMTNKKKLLRERAHLAQAHDDKKSIIWLTEQNIKNLTERIENGNYSAKQREELIKERAAFEMTLLRSRSDEKEIGNQIKKLDEKISAIEKIDTEDWNEQETATRKYEIDLSVDQTKVVIDSESNTDYFIDIEN